MKFLNLEQAAAYLEAATIEQTIDAGGIVVHSGLTEAGWRFVLVNDMYGNTSVMEVSA